MKIKNTTSQKKLILVIGALISVTLLSGIIFLSGDNRSVIAGQQDDSNGDLEVPTSIKSLEEINYEKLLSQEKGKIYEDAILKIYAIKKSDSTRIVYAYKNEPQGRGATDHFFLNIYLKDDRNLVDGAKFVNAGFYQRPKPIEFEGSKYYVFDKKLISSNYKGKVVPFSAVDHIRTGRYKPQVGRSLDLGKISFESDPFVPLDDHIYRISILTTKPEFDRIRVKRDQALSIGVLSSAEGDMVDGRIAMNESKPNKMEFRLKGDWTDHLIDKAKWSYRIIMKDGETFNGMRKLSIQHPKVRNYLWEWLLNRVVKDYGIIGLRYDFAEVAVDVSDGDKSELIEMGIMAVEESFDKILIENNKKREGVIVAFDESLYWSDIKREKQMRLQKSVVGKQMRDHLNAPIRVFNENKVLSDPGLSKQFNTAKDLLEGLRSSKYKISEVFDVDKLTTFVALYNLFNGRHGLTWHNLRMYYNPITSKLEPISFDSNSGSKLTEIRSYEYSNDDPVYKRALNEKLALVSNAAFVNNLMLKYGTELMALETSLNTEYTDVFDETVLEYNSNFIKKYLDPSLQITSDLVDYTGNVATIRVQNLSDHPVTISGLHHRDGRKLSTKQSVAQLPVNAKVDITFELNRFFVNAFVSKKNKKGSFNYPKDVSKLRIAHYIDGIRIPKMSKINPYGLNANLDSSVAEYRKSNTANFKEFDFIQETGEDSLQFISGNHKLTIDLIIPSGHTVIVESGFTLDFKNSASIKSQATFICKGTPEKPIKFFSSDGTGQGIFITNAQEKSEVAYTQFDNLSNPQSDTWSVSGAVNFHESEVAIAHSSFTNNRCEDALNIIRSEFTMSDVLFENTQSDSFDGDFVNGTLTRCTFINSGNDGIDVSGSSLVLEDIKVSNPSDKGISAGENSQISGENVKITGGEIGVVSKDLSTINLADLRIINTRLGLSAFQKKSEYGVASIDISKLILQGVAVEHLIEVNSSLTIDNKAVETVSNNVIDQMYGKEYGKSSR